MEMVWIELICLVILMLEIFNCKPIMVQWAVGFFGSLLMQVQFNPCHTILNKYL